METKVHDFLAQKRIAVAGVSRDKWAEILEKMSPEDFKYKM